MSFQIEVDVVAGTILHMFIHPELVPPFPWMNLATFGSDWTDSGEVVQGGGFFTGTAFPIWSTGPLAAGTYVFREQPVDSSFYGIAATLATPVEQIDA